MNGQDVTGILRKRMRAADGGRENIPYDHQRKCAKRALPNEQKWMLMCHDPGTGKTFTFMLIVAAMHTSSGGKQRKTMVSAPASCLPQWKSAFLNTLRIPESRILMVTQMKQLNVKSLREHDVFILSRNMIGHIFSSCYEWVTQHHQNERGNWLSQWDHKPHVPTHPLLLQHFDLIGIDEAHYMRNPTTAWTKGHEVISMNSDKVIALTATPVFNKPLDLVGISIAMNFSPTPQFKDEKFWFLDKKKMQVNIDTVEKFTKTAMDRCSDACLDLPPIVDETRDYDAFLEPHNARIYNDALMRARRLRIAMERQGKATQQELQRLMGYLQTLQQFMVSPLLALKGAREVQSNPELVRRCSLDNTGSLRALKATISQLQSEGFARILVAVCHTSLIAVAEAYLLRESPEAGDIIVYCGGLSLNKRGQATTKFLRNPKTVLLMSIEAGGTGLHLVPGSNAVVFWGSRPYSPMQVHQTKKRVHRIGQEFPVKVVHIIAKGSVDYAINRMHADKEALAKAVVDCELDDLKSENGKWKKFGRIVDGCQYLNEKTGTFPSTPITEKEMLEMALERSREPPAASADPSSSAPSSSFSAAGPSMDVAHAPWVKMNWSSDTSRAVQQPQAVLPKPQGPRARVMGAGLHRLGVDLATWSLITDEKLYCEKVAASIVCDKQSEHNIQTHTSYGARWFAGTLSVTKMQNRTTSENGLALVWHTVTANMQLPAPFSPTFSTNVKNITLAQNTDNGAHERNLVIEVCDQERHLVFHLSFGEVITQRPWYMTHQTTNVNKAEEARKRLVDTLLLGGACKRGDQ